VESVKLLQLADGTVLAACLIAVYTDMRWRRIPNVLSATLAVAALGLSAMQGIWAVLISLGLMAAVIALGLFAFSLGWLGGGDVKFMAAIAGAFGFPDALSFVLYTSVSGGILALVTLGLTGRLVSGFRNVAAMLRPLVYQGTATVAPRSSVMLPYACAIALGALSVVLSHSIAPFLRLRL
jgi:prepilin peptidase CpaA